MRFAESAVLSRVSEDELSKSMRLVVVRYFLDRPGYGLDNSAMRLWFQPPVCAEPRDISKFLQEQKIALEGLLVEVYLDRFQSFMMLDACTAARIEWDFEDTTTQSPGILNIRLTDLAHAEYEETITEEQKRRLNPFAAPAEAIARSNTMPLQPHEFANVTPSGLFSFSIMVGLETAYLWIDLVPGSVSESFVLKWGPFMLFTGGLQQILVACFQVLRNNVYGATVFLAFGSFWFANGLITILGTYTDIELDSVSDPWGNFFLTMIILAFCAALEIQTFAMNKLSTTLIGLLCGKVLFQAFVGWSVVAQWGQFAFGTVTCLFAFYMFLVELTNAIYHREVFPVHKWSEEKSPEEVFGASGRLGTLHSKATRLRQAQFYSPRTLREATAPASVRNHLKFSKATEDKE